MAKKKVAVADVPVSPAVAVPAVVPVPAVATDIGKPLARGISAEQSADNGYRSSQIPTLLKAVYGINISDTGLTVLYQPSLVWLYSAGNRHALLNMQEVLISGESYRKLSAEMASHFRPHTRRLKWYTCHYRKIPVDIAAKILRHVLGI